MAVEHATITDPQVHEPKGITTATIGKVYVADGAGSGTWGLPMPNGSDTANAGEYFVSDGAGGGTWRLNPFGFIYFENIATPYTLTYPVAYTKMAPTTTTPGVSVLVTEGSNATLTYQGSGEVMDIMCNISCDQTSGADRDLQFAIFKNGTVIPGSSAIITAVSASKRFITLSAAAPLVAGDVIACYAKNLGGSGDIRVFTFSLFLDPH